MNYFLASLIRTSSLRTGRAWDSSHLPPTPPLAGGWSFVRWRCSWRSLRMLPLSCLLCCLLEPFSPSNSTSTFPFPRFAAEWCNAEFFALFLYGIDDVIDGGEYEEGGIAWCSQISTVLLPKKPRTWGWRRGRVKPRLQAKVTWPRVHPYGCEYYHQWKSKLSNCPWIDQPCLLLLYLFYLFAGWVSRSLVSSENVCK